MIKYFFGYGLLLGIIGVLPTSSLKDVKQKNATEISIKKVSVQYGYRRPFSFYYPYNYKFYYPRQQHNLNAGECYWRYTNGSYVYSCN